MTDTNDALLETVAAVSAAFHTHDQHLRAYEAGAHLHGGFPGLWRLCADAGIALMAAEQRLQVQPGEQYEWVDAIDAMAQAMIDSMLAGQPLDLDVAATQAIQSVTYTD